MKKITIEIPDDKLEDIRHAFAAEDKPATDDQLAAACAAFLVERAAYVRLSEAKAAVYSDYEKVRA